MRPEVEHHLAAMRIVMAEGCTLREANNKLARAKWQAAQDALDALKNGARTIPPQPETQRPRPWWIDAD